MCFSFKWCIILLKVKVATWDFFVQMGHKYQFFTAHGICILSQQWGLFLFYQFAFVIIIIIIYLSGFSLWHFAAQGKAHSTGRLIRPMFGEDVEIPNWDKFLRSFCGGSWSGPLRCLLLGKQLNLYIYSTCLHFYDWRFGIAFLCFLCTRCINFV